MAVLQNILDKVKNAYEKAKATNTSSPGNNTAKNTANNTSTNNTSTSNTSTNRYNTDVYTPTGEKVSGYIENGQTYLSDGSRIGEGYTAKDASGRYWTVQNGKGVQTTQPNPVAQAYTKKYTGPRYVVRDGFTVDMEKDYQSLLDNITDPQERKIVEQARNAKIAILQEAGADNYGGQTYEYADVQLGDPNITAAYDAYIKEQNRLKSGEISSAKSAANVSLAELDAVAKELGLQNVDELRQLWVNSQLEQKALEEVLAARGITGGGAETATLDLDTAYRTNYANQIGQYNKRLAEIAQERAGIETDLATTINAIRNTYGQNVANAYAQQLQKKAESESALRNEIIARLGL